jgi:hypothetical protein
MNMTANITTSILSSVVTLGATGVTHADQVCRILPIGYEVSRSTILLRTLAANKLNILIGVAVVALGVVAVRKALQSQSQPFSWMEGRGPLCNQPRKLPPMFDNPNTPFEERKSTPVNKPLLSIEELRKQLKDFE